MIAFISVVIWSCGAVAGESEAALERDLGSLKQLSDLQFDGGIRIADAVLASQIAADIQQQLGPSGPPCGQYNPLMGVMAGNLNRQADPHTLLSSLPIPLKAITQIALDGTPVQRAVALRAITDLGTSARQIAAVLGSRQDEPSAWEAEALYATSCQKWADGGIDKLVPSAYRPPQAKDQGCDSVTASWLFDIAADKTRIWPGQFFETVWNGVAQDCGRWGNPASVTVSSDRIARLKPVLLDPATDPRIAENLLLILADLGPQTASIAPDLLPLAQSANDAVAWQAQRVIISAGVPQAVPILRQWLLNEHVFNWAWSDQIKGLAPYRDQLVPILAEELNDPTFSNRTAAAKGLGELQTPDVIPALLKAISNNDWQTTQEAINSLAPYAATHAEVRQVLENIAATYWSPRIQAVAHTALQTGHGVDGDPFSKCDVKSATGSGCVEYIGMAPTDHHLPKCKNGKLHSGKYRTSDGRSLNVIWNAPKNIPIPRGEIKDVSGSCERYAAIAVLPVDGGWLVGCSGFEFEGMLDFVPKEAGAPFKPIYHMGVKMLVQLGNHIYVGGEEPLEFGDAGALDEVWKDTDGTWKIRAIAALPADLNAYSVIGTALAIGDENNAILFDTSNGISALTCQD